MTSIPKTTTFVSSKRSTFFTDLVQLTQLSKLQGYFITMGLYIRFWHASISLPNKVSLAYKFHHIFYIFIQLAGIISSIFIEESLNHFFGAMTIFSLFWFNQAPHQLNVLFAIMLCLHRLINLKSS